MRHRIADWLNERGRTADDSGDATRARRLYRAAGRIEPSWSVPWYNLGLLEKYARRWDESLAFNQRASALNSEDEAAWWNLGIAATALRNWPEARRAWRCFGIELPEGNGEVRLPEVTACVRLNPKESGEVVWGTRIDPARIILLNIPLPESGYRFRDTVLHDGAENGSRTRDGKEFPVFDALDMWEPSDYSTYEVRVDIPNQIAEDQLVELCFKHHIGIEDWSTVRLICAECSRGNPGPHACKPDPDSATRPYALASRSEDELRMVLTEWVAKTPGAEYGAIDLVLNS